VELGHRVAVLVFYGGGPLLERLSPGVQVYSLEKSSRWDVAAFGRELVRTIKKEKPDVLYSFLTMANVVACFAGPWFPKLKVVWGVRASDMDLRRYDWLARVSYWLECRCSRWADLIVSNSAAGRRYAVSNGFPDDQRFVVIPNGIDLERFRFDEKLRQRLRAEWRIQAEETLIGIVGRLDPMKDYPTFLEAAAKMAASRHDMRFVCVGKGSREDYCVQLHMRAKNLGLSERIIWAGERSDLPAVYSALDFLVSSSAFGEGFSNVLGEAMACGVPCVATDVGDARQIVDREGVVVPPGDAPGLVRGVFELLERTRLNEAETRTTLRRRIAEEFSVRAMVERTSQALEALS
jgi:glycosyltransferase involved in cell wall biosynthesis